MFKPPDDRWEMTAAQLRAVLTTLDERGEHLIAAYVATALDFIEARREESGTAAS